jgi:hypothetical protein
MRFLIVAALVLTHSCAYASNIPRFKAIYAIIGEFEGDNMLAGACALRNRGSLSGVYGLYSKRVKGRLYSSETLVKAVKAWEDSRTAEKCLFIRLLVTLILVSHRKWLPVCICE